MDTDSEFEALQHESDPIRRGRRASDLLVLYQQRATELARLRKGAIEEAHRVRGMNYTEIATALGITKGRVTQIRSTAPRRERAFFGVGPVSISVPWRYQTTDRERPLIAAEDSATADQLERLLDGLSFAVTDRHQLEPDATEPPAGDTIVVCGPKSAPVGADLLSRDPALDITQADGRWWIAHRTTGQRFGSPSDEPQPESADLAYIARHRIDDRVVIHVAGIHSIGSLGAAHYLTSHLSDVVSAAGDKPCSLIVRADYQALTITSSELAAGPFVW
ncbi:hypothetical protein [Saccharomonospora halophila]|uniref:hypothetical protein n=1 Tax=Saccharomonospora halophila TaxID=129922 RepID=UPI00037B7B0E|nr:hypothetical protein [Saccharomonospora halophila]